MSSFMTQYGLRLSTKAFETVSWDEFCSLMRGISVDTPLGRIVAIRAETDPKVIKKFTKEQQRIYSSWRDKSANAMTTENYMKAMAELERAMAEAFG